MLKEKITVLNMVKILLNINVNFAVKQPLSFVGEVHIFVKIAIKDKVWENT